MELICDTQSLKERRLLFESVFILIEKWNLILKVVERKVLLMKPRHQYRLSQRGEWTYGAQSLKKRDYYVNPSLSKLKDEL